MIAKISHGTKIYGALLYNHSKVIAGNAEILQMYQMLQTTSGEYTTGQLLSSFLPFLALNKKTEKTALHISLNPDPKDIITDEDYIKIADEYMVKLGYGNQPYVVFKHNDIDRPHIHIVSTVIDHEGNKISDSFEKKRSMEICRELEKKYRLIPANEKKITQRNSLHPVDYTQGNIKSQIASVVKFLPKYFNFQSIGGYNALLSLFNITAEQVKNEYHGELKEGLVYFALDKNGNKISNPFKSSLFGKQAGLSALRLSFENSKRVTQETKHLTRKLIDLALKNTAGEQDFKKYLIELGINTVIRRNEQGRLYGISFIDHNTRNVFNGSHLGKQYSANIFHERFVPEQASEKPQFSFDSQSSYSAQSATLKEDLHPFFHFMSDSASFFSDWGLLDSLLLDNLAEDPEEHLFEFNMKKKKRRKTT
ncbi:conjugal transfer protein MobB [Sphingobacterium siyangense]|uniref:conjugal transfer protein MobB n=1 Tax=Sphingobacterium siyangense TaxID=459529 RepID=UPI00196589A8|nr:conjugal transfer protein MobB [Sphingobacterium siyangense]QRY55900.1 relaxase/mobilization nuclease domain-containing protein [Sphingobacterium siyangense]